MIVRPNVDPYESSIFQVHKKTTVFVVCALLDGFSGEPSPTCTGIFLSAPYRENIPLWIFLRRVQRFVSPTAAEVCFGMTRRRDGSNREIVTLGPVPCYRCDIFRLKYSIIPFVWFLFVFVRPNVWNNESFYPFYYYYSERSGRAQVRQGFPRERALPKTRQICGRPVSVTACFAHNQFSYHPTDTNYRHSLRTVIRLFSYYLFFSLFFLLHIRRTDRVQCPADVLCGR